MLALRCKPQSDPPKFFLARALGTRADADWPSERAYVGDVDSVDAASHDGRMPETSRADTRPLVVFIDDDPQFIEATRVALRSLRTQWDMCFFTEATGALEVISNADRALVVCDWRMPGCDGLTLQRKLRATRLLGGVYFILLSGAGSPQDIRVGLEHGADDYVTKPFQPTELVARIGVGLRTLRAEQELRLANDRLRRLAMKDELTGVWNRRGGLELLRREISRVRRGLQCLSVLMVDVDDFKRINDTLGHAAGDQVLHHVATALNDGVRDYDQVVRWGGEEFIVVLPGVNADQVEHIADRMLRAVSCPVDVGSRPRSVTVSIGAVSLETEVDAELDEIVAATDAALYQAKSEGKNCLRCAPPSSLRAAAAS